LEPATFGNPENLISHIFNYPQQKSHLKRKKPPAGGLKMQTFRYQPNWLGFPSAQGAGG
jgi:hypothetical protein